MRAGNSEERNVINSIKYLIACDKNNDKQKD